MSAVCTELMGVEAYNWFTSQQPLQWGYYDHPPLFSMLCKFGVALFGNTEFGVRFMNIVCQFCALYLFWFTVKTPRSDYKSAVRYFLITFSLPILHLYGFVATPNGVLFFGIALVMWALGRMHGLLDTDVWGKWLCALYLAIGLIVLCYSMHIGIAIGAVLLIANVGVFRQWQTYAAISLCLLVYMPHLLWQQAYGFVSFGGFLEADSSHSVILNTLKYSVNLLLLLNPVLIILAILQIYRGKGRGESMQTTVDRFYRLFFVLMILFCAVVSLFYDAGARLLLPLALPVVYMAFVAAEKSTKKAKIVTQISMLLGGILLLLQILVLSINNSTTEKLGLYGKKANLNIAQLTLQGAPKQKRNETTAGQKNAELLITDAKENQASLFNFYTSIPSYAMPSIYTGSSQYDFFDLPQKYHGRRVAVEVGQNYRKGKTREELWNNYRSITLPVEGTIFYQIEEFYIPTKQIEIRLSTFPEKVLTEQLLAIGLTLLNPYSFDVPLGGKSGYQIIMHIKDSEGEYRDIHLPFSAQTLGSGAEINIATNIKIPVVKTGAYCIGFTLQKAPYSSSYNSKLYELVIINPRSKI